MITHFRWLTVLFLLTSATTSLVGQSSKSVTSATPSAVDFVKDIQPIFAERCYKCHGPTKQKSDLRWDFKESGLRGGKSGAAIQPGKASSSLLIQLVSGEGELVMPNDGTRLSPAQVALLKAWIDQGAKWPDGLDPKGIDPREHWAFKRAAVPAIPKVKDSKWVKNPIDNFILARLEKEHLAPSPSAKKRTLLRRASLDLTGLPPTRSEIEAFLSDDKSDAFNRVVERLLASPHYGEKWGRQWLDVARYADSNGFEKDATRSIWPYRDWVIAAFNKDLPYDQFLVEQIAGDLLPNPTLEQKVATGYLRNSMLNEEGGVEPEQFRVEGLIDRMDALGKGVLGLTLNCAQCHNHKYDPISQKEYYQFLAFLNNDNEPIIEVPTLTQKSKRSQILNDIRALEDELLMKHPELTEKMEGWVKTNQSTKGNWIVLDPQTWFGANGVKFEKLEDHSLLATGDRSGETAYSMTAPVSLQSVTGFRVELLTDGTLPFGGPGRSANGNVVLTEFKVSVVAGSDGKTNDLVLTNATADFSQKDFPVAKAIDGDVKTGWGLDAGPGQNQDRHAVFQPVGEVSAGEGTLMTFNLIQKFGNQNVIGRYRISVTADSKPEADPLPAKIRRIVDLSPRDWSEDEKRTVFSFYRTTLHEFEDTNKKCADLLKEWPVGTPSLVLAAKPTGRTTHLFKRGDFRKPGDVVEANVPAFLPPLEGNSPRNRLTLAKWIASPVNPTTARVMVNRVWQSYFGNGIVMTSEDFGTQGERPTHPELLDWLATSFVQHDWKLKDLHRLITQSATYQQDSIVTKEIEETDPYNRLLAHGPRFRVSAEEIRDIALASSGLLSQKIGGPSVYPPIPDGVLSLGYGAPMKWETSVGEDRYRRGMYTFWKRSVPYPSLSIFDAPNADQSCARRLRSNTPLQALTTLNDLVFVEAAQALALRIFKEGGKDDPERLSYGFELCAGRKPDATESAKLLEFLQKQKDYFEDRTASAVKVSVADPTKIPEDVNLHKVAAWAMVSRILLNMDETITKE
ncbi:MAG: Protein of unknown function (DUF1553)/Protein of unknown function (DUF1549)/Planctomycete [Verrucomicrobiales bacterium]|nr:Protein of unknown function (DUF1553)/Protein of unknown function (DUF1549)/Planctomycete [Verrucomicrobiales bacterium]